MSKPPVKAKNEIVLEGIPASPGIAIGEIHLHTPEIDITRYLIDTRKIEDEINRLKAATAECVIDLNSLKEKIGSRTDALGGDIFEAHILLLQDPLLVTEVTNRIRTDKVNVEFALLETIEKLKEKFEQIDDEYIKERKMDIHDIGLRILKKLTKWDEKHKIKKPALVVAHDLTPTDTIGMEKDYLLAFVTVAGSRTSHTAIIGRSMNVPAVVGVRDIMIHAHPGDRMIVDGDAGRVVINPAKRTENKYLKKQFELQERQRHLVVLRDRGAVTLDGEAITLLANIESAKELNKALEYGAQGVGLFRTEYLFLDKREFPDEEEQYREYQKAVKLLGKRPIVFRTIDVGGDKIFKDGEYIREQNPFLGLRAIRFSLAHRPMFAAQLRAILRAAEQGTVSLMLPMISSVEELREAKKCIDQARASLKKDIAVRVGIMVEIPAAALLARHLAKEVDFFSIGTNDLLQYTLAVDRGNEHVAHLYQPLHPANLRLIKETIDAAIAAGIDVSLCGEMASEIQFVPLLIGLGLKIFSVSTVSLLEIKNIIMHCDTRMLKEKIPPLLEEADAKEVEKQLLRIIGPTIKELEGAIK